MAAINASHSYSLNATAANWNKEAGGGLLDRLKAKLGIGQPPVLSVSPKPAELITAAIKSFDARLAQINKGSLSKESKGIAHDSMLKFLETHLATDQLKGKSSSEVRGQMRSVDKALDRFASAIENLSRMRTSTNVSSSYREDANKIIADGVTSLVSDMKKTERADAGDAKSAMVSHQRGVMDKLSDIEDKSDRDKLLKSIDTAIEAAIEAVILRNDIRKFPGHDVGYVYIPPKPGNAW